MGSRATQIVSVSEAIAHLGIASRALQQPLQIAPASWCIVLWKWCCIVTWNARRHLTTGCLCVKIAVTRWMSLLTTWQGRLSSHLRDHKILSLFLRMPLCYFIWPQAFTLTLHIRQANFIYGFSPYTALVTTTECLGLQHPSLQPAKLTPMWTPSASCH